MSFDPNRLLSRSTLETSSLRKIAVVACALALFGAENAKAASSPSPSPEQVHLGPLSSEKYDRAVDRLESKVTRRIRHHKKVGVDANSTLVWSPNTDTSYSEGVQEETVAPVRVRAKLPGEKEQYHYFELVRDSRKKSVSKVLALMIPDETIIGRAPNPVTYVAPGNVPDREKRWVNETILTTRVTVGMDAAGDTVAPVMFETGGVGETQVGVTTEVPAGPIIA